MRKIWTIVALLALGGFAHDTRTPVDTARLLAAGDDGANWLTYGGTYDEQRFSPLTSIDTKNVGQLGLAWNYEFEDSARGMEATPLVADGIIYTTGNWSKVYAFDAATGRPLWSYDPKVPGATGFRACCDVVNRGPALYDGKLYVGALDGRLIALDAKTGKPVWSVQTTDPAKPYSITGAPRIVKGRVLIGNGGGEYGIRGYISAYDAGTGKLAWRFYTVPPADARPDGAASDSVIAKSRATWAGDFGRFGGGGPVWDSIVYDRAYNQVIFGVGNGTPWDRRTRSDDKGDNLFLDTVVAVDADTGAYKWHYGGSPGEVWDFDQTQSIILTTLKLGGRDRQVMLQAPKNGFFYVIDRADGKLLSAAPYATQTWTTGIDMATGRPREAPNARYQKGAFVSLPSGQGAHNWQPMAFSPQTGLAYIPAQEVPMAYEAEHPFVGRDGGWNLGIDLSVNKLPDDTASLKALRAMLTGYISAWDPVAQKERWRVKLDGPWNGGMLASAGGLLFEGTGNGIVAAYAADTGRKLWSFDAGIGIMAPPVTYAVGGKQYVAVMAGYGGGYGISTALADHAGPRPNGRLLVFSLGANTAYHVSKLPNPPAVVVAENWPAATLAHGEAVYGSSCAVCHGPTARSSGVVPDLRRADVIADKAAFQQVVIDGALTERGMVSFKKWLTAGDVEAVRGYVATRAKHLAEAGN